VCPIAVGVTPAGAVRTVRARSRENLALIAYRADGVDVRTVLRTSYPMQSSTPSEISTPSNTHDTSVVAATASLEGSLAEGINIPQCNNRCEDGGESSPVGTTVRVDGSASLLGHTEPTLSLDMDAFETFTISSEERVERDGDSSMSSILEPLPVYSPINEPTFAWGNIDGDTFSHSITCCYAEVVHWKSNLFKVKWGAHLSKS